MCPVFLFVCFSFGLRVDAIFSCVLPYYRVSPSFAFWPVVTTWPAQTIGNGPKSMQWTITSVTHSMVKTDYIEIAAIRGDQCAQQLLIDLVLDFFVVAVEQSNQNKMWDPFFTPATTRRKRKKRSIISSRIPSNRYWKAWTSIWKTMAQITSSAIKYNHQFITPHPPPPFDYCLAQIIMCL